MKRLVALTTLFPLMMLCGCGASLPTGYDAQQYIQQQFTKRGDPITVVTIRKTNGQHSVYGGIENYKVEYEAEIEFTEDCFFYRDAISTSRRKLGGQFRPAKKGDRTVVSGSVRFEKSEKGWRPK